MKSIKASKFMDSREHHQESVSDSGSIALFECPSHLLKVLEAAQSVLVHSQPPFYLRDAFTYRMHLFETTTDAIGRGRKARRSNGSKRAKPVRMAHLLSCKSAPLS